MMKILTKNRLSLLLLAILLCCKIGTTFAELAAGPNDDRRRLAETVSNPFMDTVCSDMIDDSALKVSVKDVSVVIIARNEAKSALSRTIQSVLDHSSDANKHYVKLKSIVIVDDYSDSPISSSEDIASLKAQNPSLKDKLTILRLSAHSGTAYAKNRGFKEVLAHSVDPTHHAVVFLDAHAVVSPYWLVPLTSALSRYPKALVYPTIDTLTVSAEGGAGGGEKIGVVRAESNLVAAFDWSLMPRWEPLHPERVALSGSAAEEAVEVMSPAAPGIFATTVSYMSELGLFDAALYTTSYSPSETIELSLRAWLCGGMVLKARCSRVAHHNQHLFADTAVGHGLTQASVDETALNLAQKWMDGTTNVPHADTTSNQRNYKYANADTKQGETVSYQELTFRARFLNRVPYGVELANDPILVSPAQSILTNTNTNSRLHVCLPFHWYIHSVYPGLLLDAPVVLAKFRAHMSTDYMSQTPLATLANEYNKPLLQQKQLPKQSGLLSVRASKLAAFAATAIGAGTATTSDTTFKIKRFFPEPIGPKAQTRQERLFEHSNNVQSSLICLDFPEKVYAESCEARVAGDSTVCAERKAELLFQCPRTCGFCAKEDGLFCEDFYLNKCPVWASGGRCSEVDATYGQISAVCRKSCHACTPLYLAGAAGGGAAAEKAKPFISQPPVRVEPQAKVKPPLRLSEKEVVAAAILEQLSQPMTVDPHYLHDLYRGGKLEDPPRSQDACSLRNHADAKLLSHIKLAHPDDEQYHVDANSQPLRVFCGIYTMQKNHDTNTRATRDTWAKKCDGFIAFSTHEDPLIPSINILHEGEEKYENMWQKSRSIWKYVYAHLRDDFDFFLLGGDDMFYIVENLRAYLGSVEITSKRDEGNGLFIGRIFQPPNQVVFNSGGAGYMLDRKALEVLGANIDSPKCFPHQEGFWEDVNVAQCLKVSSPSILPYDTRDDLKRERFHPFTPGNHLTYRIPKNPDWYAKYNPELKEGMDCCSDESISFHYVKSDLMYPYYNYVYHCDNKME